MRTVFFGTPDFAVPTLAAMVEGGYAPELVVSQPARPAGRGRRVVETPVAAWAGERGIAVRQPETVRDPAFLGELRALAPDVAVVVAFGQIFRRELLDLPRHGCVNLHASLLPRWRGAAPIQAAIAAGDRTTGVTTMRMDAGLDSGPILLQREIAVGDDETALELAPRLAAAGAALVVETLRRLAAGTLAPHPQDAAAVTLAPRLAKADGVIDWGQPARRLYDRWRGLVPWPGLTATLAGRDLKLVEVRPGEGTVEAPPGTVVGVDGDALGVACGGGTILALARVQRPGRQPITGRELLHGERLRPGSSRFDDPSADA